MSTADKPPTRESTEYLAMGLGIGTFGVLGAIAGSALCPVCVVATPALLGVGLYKRWRERVRGAAARAEAAESLAVDVKPRRRADAEKTSGSAQESNLPGTA